MGNISATLQGERDAIELAQRGSAAGFELLYQSHQRLVYMLCLRMSGNPATAGELMQEAFLRAFRNIATFRGEREFSAWLRRLAVDVVLTHLRRQRLPLVVLDRQRKRTAGGSGGPCLELLRTMPVDLLERIRMERALTEPRPKGRTVVMLHDLGGYTYREIAAALECSSGTSKAHLHRAHAKLSGVVEARPRRGRATASGCIPTASGGGPVGRPTRAEAAAPAHAQSMKDGLAEPPEKVRRALDAEHLRRQRDSARQELRQTQAHLRALMGDPTYGIARCDPSGRLLEGNQTLAAMLGYATCQELAAAAHAPGGLGYPLVAMDTHGGKAVEREWRRKDGSSLPVRCSGLEVSGGTGARGESQVIVEDLTAQRAQEAWLRHHATTDALTGLVNYGELLEVLERELQRSQRTGQDLALVLLDLDRLKDINDSYGHLVGNRALSRIAERLVSCCRSIDTPGRFGGDEFAVVAPETGAVAAELLALRIRACCQTDTELPRLSVSVGTACHKAGVATIENLLAAADSALYRAKSHGGRAPAEASAPSMTQLPGYTASPSLVRVRVAPTQR